MTSPIAPPDQTEEEKWYVLVVTTSIRRLHLETTGVIFGDMVTTLPGRNAFWNLHIAAVLSKPIPVRRVISDQGTSVKELERNDAE